MPCFLLKWLMNRQSEFDFMLSLLYVVNTPNFTCYCRALEKLAALVYKHIKPESECHADNFYLSAQHDGYRLSFNSVTFICKPAWHARDDKVVDVNQSH